MAKGTGRKFIRVFTVGLVTVLLPLLFNSNGWAHNYITQKPVTYIGQLTNSNSENGQITTEKVSQRVQQLRQKLRNGDVGERRNAARKLGEMGPAAKDAVDDLSDRLLNDGDNEVRWRAAEVLGKIGPDAGDAVDVLIKVLKEKTSFYELRYEAANALFKIAPNELKTIKALVYALKDIDLNIHRLSAGLLGTILHGKIKDKKFLNQAIEYIRKEAVNSNNDWQVRLGCAQAIGSSSQDVKTSTEVLTKLWEENNKEVRQNIIYSLKNISWNLRDRANTISSFKRLQNTKEGLQQAIITFQKFNKQSGSSDEDIDKLIDYLKNTIDIITFSQNKFIINTICNWIVENKVVSAPIIYVFSLLLVSFTLLWFRPLWLLKINDALLHVDIPLPSWLGSIKIPPRYGLIVGFFHYHPRVLDAWVAFHIKTAREEFEQKQTVKARKVHISIPVVLNGKNIGDLTNKDLQPDFEEKVMCVLIWGEGGVGKTSLACQLAKWGMSDKPEQRLCKHRMLPILLEQELDFQVREGKQVLIEAIRGQLRDLINSAVPISEPLLQQLLRQQRLLVIVDHFSEMSEETQKKIRPQLPEFPINALIVTSRRKEKLGGVNKTTLKPMRVEGNRLSSFMEAYLTQQGKRDLFTDEEFFEACRQLSVMAGRSNITVLLAKLYADQMIAAKTNAFEEHIPTNIPELMLYYLNQLNQSVTDRKLDNRTVQHDAKIIAWECLKQTYHPTSAKRDTILTVLDGDEPKVHLNYLEKFLHIIQTVGAAENQIRFTLDPLAEYLAGLYLVELYNDNQESWVAFLDQVDSQPNSPESIRGFLLAVRECYINNNINKNKITSNFLVDELNRRLGLSH